jgi:NADH-quinone oxidoreductase subunit F
MLIEGMIIGAYAMNAKQGFLYVRAEYPLAVERLKKAIADAKAVGILGPNSMGTPFSFDIEVVEGAGAFVCGEETALIASAEGRAGRPLPRPPFPAQRGYLGKPTTINNVETLCNVPVIIAKGSEWFTATGTENSPGTKVFSLVGKVKNTGLVELPLGTPLENIVYNMGEGAGKKKKIRAVQTGGPSGGCIPAELFATPVDYESLNALGAIMGSGGMVVLDQDNCMVDTARYFVEFTASESCGKCTPCREGLSQSLEILTRFTHGEGEESDLDKLKDLAEVIKDSSLCGLGQTSSNPVLTTLKYFKEDYLKHIHDHRCEAGVCERLFLALCENSCPLHMNIPGYLQLLKEDRIEDAFELSLRDNPLPGTVGRICHFHCQMRCRRESVDEPVNQGEIHRYLADTLYKMGKEKYIYEKLIKEKLPKTGKKIAIVGAGPAGLTAAFYLVRLGHEVTVYDEHPKAGGIMRYGIPDYRLPKDVLEKETAFIKKLGVKFQMNTRIGRDITLSELDGGNDAVFIAVGAQKDLEIDLPGTELAGVHPGYELLEKFAQGKAKGVGKEVVIIGGGNVAIDAARTCIRLGAKTTIVYRRDRDALPANPLELAGAEEEGVEFLFLSGPKRIVGENGKVTGLEITKMALGDVDTSGRRRPVSTGKTRIVPCDTVIIAAGEKVDSEFLKVYGVKVNKDGTIKANHITLNAGPAKFYAGGDAVTGPATAAEAMGLARKAAEAIDSALMGEKRFQRLFVKFVYKNEVPAETPTAAQSHGKMVPVKDRVGNFQEICLGYTGEQARFEAERCLRCDVRITGH